MIQTGQSSIFFSRLCDNSVKNLQRESLNMSVKGERNPNESKYSRMIQVKFVEDSLKKFTVICST